jgi:CBS domain-containing protein
LEIQSNDPTPAAAAKEIFMKTASDLLKSKLHQTVFTIAPTSPVFEALQLMADKNIGAVLVMEGTKVVGIVSERDCARKVTLMSRSSSDTQVREIMTADVMYVRPEQTTEECMALMTENRLRHLPIMNGDQLLGLVSIGDLVKDIISEQKFIIAQLEHYISGQPE